MATDADKGGRDRPNARARSAHLRQQQRKQEARRRFMLIGGIVTVIVVIVVVMVVIYLTKSDKKNATATAGAPPAAVAQVTGISAGDLAKGDTSKVTALPTKVSGPALTFDSKPGLLYFGAEYCPFCAVERWPLVVAMSRFGTWSNLGQTTSASQDVFPSTPTFSFVGARFSSQYLGFSSVETETNQLVNGSYTKLQTPTAQQSELLNKYDPKGSIPFVDYGNKFVTVGASYDPTVLKGRSFDEIAAAVADPSSAIGKSVLGAANVLTAAICEMTGGKPGSVCELPDIKKLRGTLNAQ